VSAPPPGDLVITRASVADAAQILDLQKQAYQSEARLYEDWNLPPLTQTLESIIDEFGDSRVLMAMAGGLIVGSVRAREAHGICHVGRLVVRPDRQGCGIGTRLMQAIESEYPGPTRFQLFTGSRSEGNIRLYQRLGYRRTHDQVLSPAVTLTFMEKHS
jgi:ribosomal protein S18 acetylase RimI-like enzyme